MEPLPVAGDLQTVRSLHFGGEFSDLDRSLDDESGRSKLDPVDEVGGLGAYVNPIIRRRRRGSLLSAPDSGHPEDGDYRSNLVEQRLASHLVGWHRSAFVSI